MNNPRDQSLLSRLITLPPRHPWATLMVAMVLAIGSFFAVRTLTIDASLEKMFSRDDPSAAAGVRVLSEFAAMDDLLVLVTQPPDAQGTVELTDFAGRLERAIHADAHAAAMVTDITYRVDPQSRAFFERVLIPHGLFYLDDEELTRLRERLSADQIAWQIRRNEALIAAPGPAAEALAKNLLRDPLRLHEFVLDRLESHQPFRTLPGSDALISADGRSLLIRITGTRPPSDIAFSRELTESIRELAMESNTARLELDISGAYAIAAASERAIRRDMIVTVLSAVTLLQVFFMLAFRRPLRSFSLAFAPVALGVLFGFGAYALTAHELTPMTAVIGGILAGLGIDYTIHYLSHYRAHRGGGAAAVEAAGETSRALALPLLAAWLTSVFGFVAIGWSSTAMVRDFAILGAFGLAGAFLAALVVLPAMLVVTARSRLAGELVRRASGEESGEQAPRLNNSSHRSGLKLRIEPMLRVLSRRPTLWLACGAVIAAAAIVVVATQDDDLLPLETDLTVMHPRPNPPLEAQHRIAECMGTSADSLIVYMSADSPAELVALAHDANRRLESAQSRDVGITGTFGLASLLPDPRITDERAATFSPDDLQRILQDFHGSIEQSVFDWGAVEPYAQFLERLLTASSPPQIDSLLEYEQLAETILPRHAFDQPAEPVTEAITFVFIDRPLTDRATRGQIIDTVRSALSDLDNATLTGLSVIRHDTEHTIHRDLPRLMLIAVAVVAAFMLVYFRSIIDALLALLPTAFALLCLAAFMHLSHAKLNMVNLVSIPLLIGICVDYGIFLVSRARWRSLRHTGTSDLLDRITPTCHAVMISAATTTLGFGSLVFTSVPAIRSLGLTVGIGVAGGLAATLFLLVPIYAMKTRRAS